MTKFYIKDERKDDDAEFHQVTRKLYKKIISISDKLNAAFRVNTFYVDGVPTKMLTLLDRPNHG